MSNKQEQEDELEVLHSIYGEEIFIVNERQSGGIVSESQSGGQFLVHPTVPQPFTIISHPEGGVKQEVQVSFLPPIVLHFLLPEDYPSRRSPRFVLSCQWLTRKQLSSLCQQLDRLWLECQPEVVLFRWTQFLQENALAHLDLRSQLDITPLVTATGYTNFGNLALAIKKEFSLATEDAVEAKNPSPPKNLQPRSTNEIIKSHLNSNFSHRDRDSQLNDGPKLKGRARGRGSRTTETKYKNGAQKKEASDELFRDGPLGDQELLKKLDITPSKSHDHEKQTVIQEDCRAVVDLKQGAQPLPIVVEFNESKKRDMFNKEWFKCKVCLEENLGNQCLQFIGCHHVFCKNCMQVYFEVQIKEGNVRLMTCPEDKCSSQATPAQVYELVGADLFERYDSMLLVSSLATMGDVTYCPRKSCQFMVIKDHSENLATCQRCFFVFCHFCRKTYHGLEPCRLQMEEKLEIINNYQKGSAAVKLELEKRYGKKQLTTMMEDAMSEKWVKDCTKKCPQCSASIQKIDGCNKMSCWRCNTFFCWLCTRKLDAAMPYAHFNDTSSKCFNLLFEHADDDDEDWEFGQFL